MASDEQSLFVHNLVLVDRIALHPEAAARVREIDFPDCDFSTKIVRVFSTPPATAFCFVVFLEERFRAPQEFPGTAAAQQLVSLCFGDVRILEAKNLLMVRYPDRGTDPVDHRLHFPTLGTEHSRMEGA